ncbi:MAG TPA: cupin domain-containing protein [Casimicrobiaceae bacterium]
MKQTRARAHDEARTGTTPAAMLLSARDIDAMPGTTKVHAFNRSGVRLDKSLGYAAGMQRLGAHLVSVMPGYFSSEFHHHHFAEECVYVLAGEGRAHIGERVVALAPGDFVGYPANGVAHAIEATGSGLLVCLVVGERLAQDVID